MSLNRGVASQLGWLHLGASADLTRTWKQFKVRCVAPWLLSCRPPQHVVTVSYMCVRNIEPPSKLRLCNARPSESASGFIAQLFNDDTPGRRPRPPCMLTL